MKFDINEFVLDPRPESEILVEKALDLIQENNLKSILELGVGSGCIIAAILSNSIGTKAVGIDISEKAIMTAKSNLIKNNIYFFIIFKSHIYFLFYWSFEFSILSFYFNN